MSELKIVYRDLPVSSNLLYIKGTILTKVAREYAERFSYNVVRDYLPQISLLNPEGIYALHLKFFFPNIINETWYDPNTPASKKPKSRYKRIDLSNRIKLLEDCIRDAIAIDDCQIFYAIQEKHYDPVDPRVEIVLWELDPKSFGVP